jgi:hypothetical protein
MYGKYIPIFYLAFSMLFVSSCKKETAVPNNTVIAASHVFYIDENSSDSTEVGTVIAADKDPWQVLHYEIVEGNDDSAFYINPVTGKIYINKSEKFDFETLSTINLKVVIRDDNEKTNTDTSIISVNINNIQPSLNGLMAYYPLNGDATDSIGTFDGTPGQYVGYFNDRNNANPNGACEFIDFKSYITLGSSFDYPLRTVSLWFKLKYLPDSISYIYCSDNSSIENGLTTLSIINSSGSAQLVCNVSNNKQTVNIELDTWYQAAILVDETDVTFYLNGQSVSAATKASPAHSTAINNFAILGAGPLTDFFFGGLVDDVYIYNRALSDKEIQVLFKE